MSFPSDSSFGTELEVRTPKRVMPDGCWAVAWTAARASDAEQRLTMQ